MGSGGEVSLPCTHHVMSCCSCWVLWHGLHWVGLLLSSGSVHGCLPLFVSHGAQFRHWGSWVSCDMVLQCSSSLLLCAVVVGEGVEWRSIGYSLWHCIYNNDKQQLLVIVHCLVATSPTAMWHLDPILERSIMRGRWASPQFLVICFHSCMLTVIFEPWQMVVVKGPPEEKSERSTPPERSWECACVKPKTNANVTEPWPSFHRYLIIHWYVFGLCLPSSHLMLDIPRLISRRWSSIDNLILSAG